MRLHEALRYRQAQSRALVSLGRTRLMKLLKDGFQLIRRNPDSGITHRNISERGISPCRNGDLSATRSKLQGIAGQVVQDLLETLPVCTNGEAGSNIDLEVNGFLPVDLRNPGENLLNHGTNFEFVQFKLEPA